MKQVKEVWSSLTRYRIEQFKEVMEQFKEVCTVYCTYTGSVNLVVLFI
jgi:hypothetical protein